MTLWFSAKSVWMGTKRRESGVNVPWELGMGCLKKWGQRLCTPVLPLQRLKGGFLAWLGPAGKLKADGNNTIATQYIKLVWVHWTNHRDEGRKRVQHTAPASLVAQV